MNIFNYNTSEYGQNWNKRARNSWAARIDYGSGGVETMRLPSDVGSNHYYIQTIMNKIFGYEQRTGYRPTVEYYTYNPVTENLKYGINCAITAVAFGAVGASFAAGFLDRYRLTLAARIDGLNKSISVLGDLTKPCVEQLPKVIKDLKGAADYLAKAQAKSLELATAAFHDAARAKEGVEVCANLARDFSTIVEPMERVNEAMKGEGLFSKMGTFIANLDMATARAAWKDYSIGEQSLGYLYTTAKAVSVGYTVHAAGKAICKNVLSLSEENANLTANVAGALAGMYVATYGTGLLQAASIGLLAVGTKIAANALGWIVKGGI